MCTQMHADGTPRMPRECHASHADATAIFLCPIRQTRTRATSAVTAGAVLEHPYNITLRPESKVGRTFGAHSASLSLSCAFLPSRKQNQNKTTTPDNTIRSTGAPPYKYSMMWGGLGWASIDENNPSIRTKLRPLSSLPKADS
jgi:hypothetical protein